jgi:type I restriction enzyme S subunit
MTAQDLKNSILQRAIEGKLVPQRKEEGTARELLAEIRAEKARLIKEKKIKKTRPLPAITDDEKPFNIPDSWEWVRLGEVSTYGQKINKIVVENMKPDMWLLDMEDIEKGTGRIIRHKLVKSSVIRGDKAVFHKGDLLYSKLRPYLKKILIAPEDGICTSELVPFQVYQGINPLYAIWWLHSPSVDQKVNTASYGVKMPRVGKETMINLLLPLPPLAEQHRIVAKIEELQPDIDAYDKAQTELAAIEERFPDDMKKSLLQYAIEGKLVPQRKEEGTAKDLLAEIRAEKARLVKEKKIKKSKPLPAITDNEKPFAIPDSWEWVWLEGLIFHISSKKYQIKQKDINTNGLYPVVSQSMNKIEGYSNDSKKILHLDKPVLVFGDHSRTLKLIDFDFIVGADGTKIMQLINNDFDIRYLYYALRYNINRLSPRNYGRHYSQLSNMPIPVPPLAEQHRIVAKLEELLPLCEQLAVAP